MATHIKTGVLVDPSSKLMDAEDNSIEGIPLLRSHSPTPKGLMIQTKNDREKYLLVRVHVGLTCRADLRDVGSTT